MPDRTTLLNGLSLLLILAAVLVLLVLEAPDLSSRPDLHWTTTGHFFAPRQSSEEIRDH